MSRILAALLIALAFAGCVSDPPALEFDGSGAYDYVVGLVQNEDGPVYRVPGTEGHAAALAWLSAAANQPGWDVAVQSFTGEQYKEIVTKSTVNSYAHNSSFCLQRDREELPNMTFSNVVARYGSAEPTILLGAHWDSKEEASQHPSGDPNDTGAPVLGANDGASGVGVLLQLMEHIAAGDYALDVSLMVVFFDGEDGFEDCHPLAGSIYHAHSLADDEVDAMILLDMVGDKDARFPQEGRSRQSAPELLDLIWSLGPDVGLEDNLVGPKASVFDDHVPYIERGIPAVDLIDFGRTDTAYGFPPYWHTRDDTLANIDPAMLGKVGNLMAKTLAHPELAAAITS